MNEEILRYLREINFLSLIIRLALAVLLGGVIGFERGKKNRPAGLRTHILVCIGSTLAMSTNQYVVEYMGGIGDPTRLGAQVISGIGFLGAGTILVTGKQQVKGLTTAAGLWASACMGLAIGIGFYEGAIISFVFIFGVMTILNKLDNYMLGKSKIVDLYIGISDKNKFREFIDILKENNMKIKYVEIDKGGEQEGMNLFVTIQQMKRKKHSEVIHFIKQTGSVDFVEEI